MTKPFPVYNAEPDNEALRERVLIKFNKADLEKANMLEHGGLRLHLPETLQKTGDYTLEYGEVVAVSKNEKWLKKGDKIACSYMLLMIERANGGLNIYPQEWLGKDEEGNEYSIPKIEYFTIFAKILPDRLEPMENWVFCELPTFQEKDKVGSFFIPETAKVAKTNKRPYSTRILYMNPADKNKTGLKEGDLILCDKNSDIPIKLQGKTYIRVPIEYVVSKLEEKVDIFEGSNMVV